MIISYFRYVPRERIEAFEALGWTRCEMRQACHHDVYSILMEWCGDGEPPEPAP